MKFLRKYLVWEEPLHEYLMESLEYLEETAQEFLKKGEISDKSLEVLMYAFLGQFFKGSLKDFLKYSLKIFLMDPQNNFERSHGF